MFALALETDLRMLEWAGRGIPASTSFMVSSSAAVPLMPNRKWSWFSIRKISTSWLSLYSSGDMSWLGWESMPGWKMAARLFDGMRFWSDLEANTARRSRM